jgi:DNA polymerase-3 subunit gamma/tau
VRGADFAQKLSVRTLSRAWQILLKGIPEVQAANRPVAAAEMVLVRLAYAADLPTPDEALRSLKDGAPLPSGGPPAPSPKPNGPSGTMALAASQAQPQPRPQPSAEPTLRLRRFEDVVALAGEKREIVLKAALERDVRLVRFEEGRIELSLTETGSRTIANDLTRALQQWTGERWMVALSSEEGEATLHEKAVAAERERKAGAANHPLVQAVLSRFPGAQIVNVVERAEKAGEDAEAEILGEADAGSAHESEADDDL